MLVMPFTWVPWMLYLAAGAFVVYFLLPLLELWLA
jgi:hypothetical protein